MTKAILSKYTCSAFKILCFVALFGCLVWSRSAQAGYWEAAYTYTASGQFQGVSYTPDSYRYTSKPFTNIENSFSHGSPYRDGYIRAYGGSNVPHIFAGQNCSIKVTLRWVRGYGDSPTAQPPSKVSVLMGAYIQGQAFSSVGTATPTQKILWRTYTNFDTGFSGDPVFTGTDNQGEGLQYYNLNWDNRTSTRRAWQYHVKTLNVSNGTAEFTVPLSGRVDVASIGGFSPEIRLYSGFLLKRDNREGLIQVRPFRSNEVMMDWIVKNEPEEKELNAYVKVGYYNDGVPENPLVQFFEGASTFDFSGSRNGSAIALRDYKWSVSPDVFLPQTSIPDYNAPPGSGSTYNSDEHKPETSTPRKNFHWNLGPVENADPSSFPKSTVTTVEAVDPSDGAKLHGTAKINWHLSPATLYDLKVRFTPLSPENEPDDVSPDADVISVIQDYKQGYNDAFNTVGTGIKTVQTGGEIVASVIMPDELDLLLGAGKAVKVGKAVHKAYSALRPVAEAMFQALRAKKIARGKKPYIGLKTVVEGVNRGKVGTRHPNVVYGEAEEATGATEATVKVIGKACFVAGTPILMADGTRKPIEEVKVGERVLARDEITRRTETKRVLRTFVKQAPSTIALTFSNNESVETTDEHPFYVESRGFTAANELNVDDAVVVRSGSPIRLVKIQRRDSLAKVYNFEVEEYHTYFVGKSALWVHNADCDADELADHAWDHVLEGQFDNIPEAPLLNKQAFSDLISYIMRNLPMHDLPRGRYGWFDESRGIIVIHDISLNAPNPGTVIRPIDPHRYWDDLLNDRL